MAFEELEQMLQRPAAFAAALRRNSESYVTMTDYGTPDGLGSRAIVVQSQLPSGLPGFVVEE